MPRPLRLALVAVLALLVTAAPGPAARQAGTVTDDFAAYAEGSDAAAGWDTDGIGWAVTGGRLVSDGVGHSFALARRAPYARRVTLEAVVTVRRTSGTEWKTAGVALVHGDDDYWHLALVESPDTQGRRHYVELSEKLAGTWLAQGTGATALRATASAGNDLAWQFGKPYRMRITVTADGIEGTVSQADGTVVTRLGFAFDDRRAVKSGKPALVTSGLAAEFENFAAEALESAPAPGARSYPPYRRLAATPPPARGKRTGYFHVEKLGGRWWMVDPEGAAFYGVGTDHVNFNAHWCEKLGYAPYSRNVAAKYGTEEAWAKSSTDRLKAWGFNSLGAGHSPSARYRGLAHTEFLSLGVGFVGVSHIAPRTTWTGFPDVFHPRFEAFCRRQARRVCAPLRTDPWLIGYFIDNELEWFGKNGSETGLVDEAFKRPAGHPAKQALVDFLRGRYPAIEDLNSAWGTRVADYGALAAGVEPPQTRTPRGTRDRLDFVRLIADRYFRITTAAIREADPNHMVLGCRFAGSAPPVWDIAGKYLDIVTVNFYGQVDLERGVSTDMPRAMARTHARSGRPLMITEWSFPAPDAGLPSVHGAGQRVPTQADKAFCYDVYQRALFGMPFMVGSNYFMWVDEPALGISSTFPEDSNYGLVDVDDKPWEALTRTAARVNRLADRLHARDTSELRVTVTDTPGSAPVVRVRNSGRRGAACWLAVWVQGREQRLRIAVAPGATLTHRPRVQGLAFVAAEADPEKALVEAERADNRAQRVTGLWRLKQPALVVVNASDRSLERVPIATRLPRPGLTVKPPPGVQATVQRDDLPDGAWLAVRLARVPARTALALPLAPGSPALSRVTAGGDRSIVLPGPLSLAHDAGSGHVFDRVSLGDIHLGRLAVLMHQVTGQPLWVHPDRVEAVTEWHGLVRSTLDFTVAVAGTQPGGAITAVDGGVYAAQAQRPHRYRAVFRITRWAGEPWFSVRFMRLENTDDRPWRCASYFVYPLSAIGGRAEDDRPVSAGAAPLWHDEARGLSYGALVDSTRMQAQFFKDDPAGAGQHPDIWRALDRQLAPGEVVNAATDEPEVWLYGGRGGGNAPGGKTLARLRALRGVRAVRTGR